MSVKVYRIHFATFFFNLLTEKDQYRMVSLMKSWIPKWRGEGQRSGWLSYDLLTCLRVVCTYQKSALLPMAYLTRFTCHLPASDCKRWKDILETGSYSQKRNECALMKKTWENTCAFITNRKKTTSDVRTRETQMTLFLSLAYMYVSYKWKRYFIVFILLLRSEKFYSPWWDGGQHIRPKWTDSLLREYILTEKK